MDLPKHMKKEMECLPREMVDACFHDPFITSGYREPGMNFKTCLKTIFLPNCNESVNVWSHLLFGFYFAAKFWNILTNEFNSNEHFTWPLVGYMIGTVGFCIVSAGAHTFNCLSPYWRRHCFYFDYAAISVYCFSYCQAFYFYSSPVHPDTVLREYPKLFLGGSLLLSLLCTWCNCVSASLSHRVQYIIRVGVCAAPFLLAASPLLHRYLFCVWEVDCDLRAFPLYAKECFLLVLVIVVYASKFPERWVSRTFDCFGQSHNVFHVLICVAADFKFEFVKAELVNRRRMVEPLMKGYSPYSVHMMTLAAFLNVALCFCIEKVHFNQVNAKGTAN